MGDSNNVDAILRALPDAFRYNPAYNVGTDFSAVETPLVLPDGDALPIFYDRQRDRFADLGETMHWLLASGVPIEQTNWLPAFEATLQITGVRLLGGALVTEGPASAALLLELVQSVLRLGEHAAMNPVRPRPIFRETVKAYLKNEVGASVRTQYRLTVQDAQLTFDFYVEDSHAFIKTLATPSKFVQPVGLTMLGTWDLVRAECSNSTRVTVVGPHVRLPRILIRRLEDVSCLVPWENRTRLKGLLRA